jgi:hypothetical protein
MKPYGNICPVCGYDHQSQIEDHKICPCCRLHYGYQDAGWKPKAARYAQLRQEWMARGAKWESKRLPQPPDWSAAKQLLNIGIVLPTSPEATP